MIIINMTTILAYYCVLDFEATCWKDVTKPTQEIIEFPSALYKMVQTTGTSPNTIEMVFMDEFSKYVRPVLEPTLSKFCTELTGIEQQTVDAADTFDVVYKQHKSWLHSCLPKNAELYFVTCGNWDLLTMLPKELKNKNLLAHAFYSKWINAKTEFEYFYKLKSGGMARMLSHLGLSLDGRHHSGIDDTRNIAKIFSRMVADKHTDFQIKYVR